MMLFLRRLLYTPFFIRLLHWEYWSFNVVYTPIYFYWFWLCIKARSFFFFNAANPSIKNGGFLLESKKEIYDIIPQQYYPKTILIRKNSDAAEMLSRVKQFELQFPLIAKPDIGMRGLSVKKLETNEELCSYLQNSKVDFIVQEFVSFPHEVGIFYYRMPNEEKGHISGIVGKEFLTVTGNGRATIQELLQQDKRFILQLGYLQKTYADVMQNVLAAGQSFLMVPYGNHARGAKFIDLTYKANEALTNTIDNICKQVPGFYFGRLDLRYNTWDEMVQGKNISIIELNGAGSEPTHMYDPGNSIFHAWKEIIRHWILLSKISRINHAKTGIPYMSTSEGLAMFRENKAYVRIIESQEF